MSSSNRSDYQRYICRVCGYVYDEAKGDPEHGLAPGTRFEAIPDDWQCPDCLVTKADFELLAPAGPATEAVPATRWGAPAAETDAVVIVGGGMAGWAAAEELRRLDSERPIQLLATDSGDYYYKPQISNAFAKGLDGQSLLRETAAERGERLGITVLPRVRVLAIDRERRRLVTPRGGISYGDLILATGARPRHPVFPGDGPQPLAVNSLDDYRVLRRRLLERSGGRVAVIGAGLVGCELADDLVRGGYEVTLLEQAPRPLVGLLPEALADDLTARLGESGVTLHTGCGVSRIDALDSPSGGAAIQLTDGRRFEADRVISALGLIANTELAAATGLTCDQGITVDANLTTSDPHIRALGDCAAFGGRLRPYVTPLMAQARVIAANLSGTPTTYTPDPGTIQVKTTSLPLSVCPPDPATGTDGEWVCREQGPVGSLYLFEGQGRLLGFAASGELITRTPALEAALGRPLDAEMAMLAS
ncbi:MAG: FAD-dependent oxidoreductase [Pseudomonadota bacterium]